VTDKPWLQIMTCLFLALYYFLISWKAIEADFHIQIKCEMNAADHMVLVAAHLMSDMKVFLMLMCHQGVVD
jgi:hypothetical protein